MNVSTEEVLDLVRRRDAAMRPDPPRSECMTVGTATPSEHVIEMRGVTRCFGVKRRGTR